MSRFSGKCDLYDCIMIHKSFKEFKKRFPYIYIGHSNTPISYRNLKDLVQYYPYIPWYIYSEKKRNGIMRISEKSYVDEREEQGIITKELAEYYRGLLEEEKEKSNGSLYEKTAGFAE